MSDRQAETIVDSCLNINTIELIYKRAMEMVKKCIVGNIFQKFTDYLVINVHHKSAREIYYLKFQK